MRYKDLAAFNEEEERMTSCLVGRTPNTRSINGRVETKPYLESPLLDLMDGTIDALGELVVVHLVRFGRTMV